MLVTLAILVSVPLAPAAVRNVNVMRINNTAVSVSWTPLTLTEGQSVSTTGTTGEEGKNIFLQTVHFEILIFY